MESCVLSGKFNRRTQAKISNSNIISKRDPLNTSPSKKQNDWISALRYGMEGRFFK